MPDAGEPSALSTSAPETTTWWRRHRWSVVLLLVWCAVTAVAMIHHEQWRDEADTWLFARDVPWSGFFAGGRYSGSPQLWHLLQVPFARAGLPYESQRALHWVIAFVTTTFFVFRCPLPWLARAAFTLSYFGAFEYAVVSRSYALTLLFLWLACASWRHRRVQLGHGLAVALLAQTNVPGMILASALLAVGFVTPASPTSLTTPLSRLPWRERLPSSRVAMGGVVIAVLGLLFAVAQVWPPVDGQKAGEFHELNARGLTIMITRALFPLGNGDLRAVCGVVIFALILTALWRLRAALAFFVITWLGLTVLFYAVHIGFIRHHGFIVVALVAAAWIALSETEPGSVWPRFARWLTPTAMVVITLVPWCLEGARMLAHERHGRFSNAPQMAQWLDDHGLLHREFALAINAIAVVPWLDADKVYYPAIGTRRTYLPWDKNYARHFLMPEQDQARIARDTAPHALLLLVGRLKDPETHGYRLVHAENRRVFSTHGEKLYLYAPLAEPPIPGEQQSP